MDGGDVVQLVGTQFILSDHFMDRCIERGCGKWDTLVSIFKDVYIPYKGNYKVYAGGASFVVKNRVIVTCYPSKNITKETLIVKEC